MKRSTLDIAFAIGGVVRSPADPRPVLAMSRLRFDVRQGINSQQQITAIEDLMAKRMPRFHRGAGTAISGKKAELRTSSSPTTWPKVPRRYEADVRNHRSDPLVGTRSVLPRKPVRTPRVAGEGRRITLLRDIMFAAKHYAVCC